MDDTLSVGEKLIIKVIGNFPESNIDLSDQVSSLQSLLASLNWFIPFYRFAQILNVWASVMGLLLAGIAFYKFIYKGLWGK